MKQEHSKLAIEFSPLRLFRRLLLVCVLAAGWNACEKKPSKPNILLITIDTLRLDHVGCYGSKEVSTPNLDSIARQGILFENSYATMNSTIPSHLSIFSSKYPFSHGSFNQEKYDISGKLTLLPSLLRPAGYRSYGITSAFFFRDTWLKGFSNQFDSFSAPKTGELKAAKIVEKFQSILPELKQRKFFVWLHLYDPHAPYDPPVKYKLKYDAFRQAGRILPDFSENDPAYWTKVADIHRSWAPAALYRGEVSYSDEAVGKIWELLKASSLDRNTVVLIVADHGEMLGDRGFFYDHQSLYNPAIRVPFLISAPWLKARKVKSFVSGVDIAPTVLELAGLQPPKDFEGVSLVGLLMGEQGEVHDVLYSQHAWDIQVAAIRPPNKLIYIRPDVYELYNVVRDPSETDNLMEYSKAVAEQLKKDVQQPEFKPRNYFANQPLNPEDREALRSLGYVH